MSRNSSLACHRLSRESVPTTIVIEEDTDCADRVDWRSEIVGSSSSGITDNLAMGALEDVAGFVKNCLVKKVVDVIPSWLVKVVEDTLLEALKGEPVTLGVRCH